MHPPPTELSVRGDFDLEVGEIRQKHENRNVLVKGAGSAGQGKEQRERLHCIGDEQKGIQSEEKRALIENIVLQLVAHRFRDGGDPIARQQGLRLVQHRAQAEIVRHGGRRQCVFYWELEGFCKDQTVLSIRDIVG